MTDQTLTRSDAAGDPGASLTELRDQAIHLARQLPGQLQRIRVATADNAVEIEWAASAVVVGPQAIPVPPPAAPAAGTAPAVGAQPVQQSTQPAPPATYAITAPLVGTFYGAPAPGEPPFIAVGDVVRPGQQVAIVEAMKLMNAITADRAGVVRAIRVSEGEMVEFDQVLLEIEPTGNEG